MNIKHIFLLIFVAATIAVSDMAFAAGPAVTFPSAWKNQRNSILELDSVDATTGKISGVYYNRADGTNCKIAGYPVVGWVHGDSVGFTVSFNGPIESCETVTSWVGYIKDGKIYTKWYLIVDGTGTIQDFNGQNADIFSPLSARTYSSMVADK